MTNVFEMVVILRNLVAEIAHRFSRPKDAFRCEHHWIRQDRVQWALVSSDVIDTSIENLSHRERADFVLHLSPELLLNLRCRVDTESVAPRDHNALGERDQLVTNEWNTLVEVGKSCEPAMLDLRLIPKVLDVARSWTSVAAVGGKPTSRNGGKEIK